MNTSEQGVNEGAEFSGKGHSWGQECFRGKIPSRQEGGGDGVKTVGASVGEFQGRGGKPGLPDGFYFFGEEGVKDLD